MVGKAWLWEFDDFVPNGLLTPSSTVKARQQVGSSIDQFLFGFMIPCKEVSGVVSNKVLSSSSGRQPRTVVVGSLHCSGGPWSLHDQQLIGWYPVPALAFSLNSLWFLGAAISTHVRYFTLNIHWLIEWLARSFCGVVWVWTTAWVWRAKTHSTRWVPGKTRAINLGNECLYPRSHHTSP